jgi:hypothetical protein
MIVYKNGLSVQNARFLQSIGLKLKILYNKNNKNGFPKRYREIPIRRQYSKNY